MEYIPTWWVKLQKNKVRRKTQTLGEEGVKDRIVQKGTHRVRALQNGRSGEGRRG